MMKKQEIGNKNSKITRALMMGIAMGVGSFSFTTAQAQTPFESQGPQTGYAEAQISTGQFDALLFANGAISMMNALQPYLTIQDQATYLLPIKNAAGRLKSVAKVRGPYSGRLHESFMVLLVALQRADAFVEHEMGIEIMFNSMVDLLELGERIEMELK